VKSLACLLALAACAEEPAHDRQPVVVIYHDGAARPEYLAGASAWEPLGFEFVLGSDVPMGERLAPECGRQWFQEGCHDCQITLSFIIDPLLYERSGYDAAAVRDSRAAYFDEMLLTSDTPAASSYLKVAVAHEVGHLILDTAEHTEGGIMGGAVAAMRDVDYALACRAIGVCL
jgi:hypothetical protein